MQFAHVVEFTLYTVCHIIIVDRKLLLALIMARNGENSLIKITVFLLSNGRKIWLKSKERFCDLT
jgi:hypothetical protein